MLVNQLTLSCSTCTHFRLSYLHSLFGRFIDVHGQPGKKIAGDLHMEH